VEGRAVSKGHLVELLPLAKMMKVEKDSKQLGADAPPVVVVQVVGDLSPHHLRPLAVWPVTMHSHLPKTVSQAVYPPYRVSSLSTSEMWTAWESPSELFCSVLGMRMADLH
jgi:hypothetical protein